MASLVPTGARSTKHMRIGTRSCTECRRRKRRCIFIPSASNTCQRCLARDTPCIPQGSTDPLLRDETCYRKKRSHLTKSVTLNGDRSCAQESLETRTARHANCNSSSAAAMEGAAKASTDSSLWADMDDSDIPLLRFLARCMTIKTCGESDHSDPARVPAVLDELPDSLLRDLIHDTTTLDTILRMTKRYWHLWPCCPDIGHAEASESSQIDSVRQHLRRSIAPSSSPAVRAKGVLWLTLCFQQLPAEFSYYCTAIKTPHDVVIKKLAAHAIALLQAISIEDYEPTMIEAYMLHSKIMINLGCPRQAWQHIRTAANLALLLKLHRSPSVPFGGNSNVDERQLLWAQIWQTDHQLSLILGLPPFLPPSHPLFAKTATIETSLESKLSRQLAMIAARICDRNEETGEVAHAMTLTMEKELDMVYAQLPLTWLVPDPPTQIRVTSEKSYTQQTIIMLCMVEYIMLYLCYIFQTTSENPAVFCKHGRNVAVTASRTLIRSYINLHTQADLVVCELMDFQAFMAGLLLIISHLHQSEEEHEDQTASASPSTTEDASLVSNLINALKQLSLKMHCMVAGQAVIVLERLFHVAYQDGSTGNPGSHTLEPFDAVIPYFGRLRIHPKISGQVLNMKNGSSTPDDAEQGYCFTASDETNMVEFDFSALSDLAPVSSAWSLLDEEMMMPFDNVAELGGAWLTG